MQKSQTNNQMFLTKKFKFDSAHKLPNYDGKCKNLHGHTYFLEVTITGEMNNKTGMLLDFGIVKNVVKELIVEKFDHQYINNIIENPTAENMIRWIWNVLFDAFNKHNVKLFELKLWETPDSCVSYKKTNIEINLKTNYN
jgi:6-pyruvoyltetrahydropterin/6-carboxytetrahydropterin synthase